jgi:hypothetical protein
VFDAILGNRNVFLTNKNPGIAGFRMSTGLVTSGAHLLESIFLKSENQLKLLLVARVNIK